MAATSSVGSFPAAMDDVLFVFRPVAVVRGIDRAGDLAKSEGLFGDAVGRRLGSHAEAHSVSKPFEGACAGVPQTMHGREPRPVAGKAISVW